MTEEKKPFTVSDRRHFTPEGEARAREGEAPSTRPGPAATAEAEGREAARPRPEGAAPDRAAAHAGGAPPEAPASFVGLLLSLGAQAAMLLGGGGDPEGSPTDPEGARALITLLEVLQEKTEGRRTPEEDEVLESLLYQLRMEYLARTTVKGA